MASLIEADTLADATLQIAVLSQVGFILHSLQGYTVDAQGIVPVNAKTGQVDTSKTHVTTWAVPKQPDKETYDVWYYPDPRDAYGDDFSFVQSLSSAQATALAQQFMSANFTQDHINQFMADPSLTTVLNLTGTVWRTVASPHVGDYTQAEIAQYIQDMEA